MSSKKLGLKCFDSRLKIVRKTRYTVVLYLISLITVIDSCYVLVISLPKNGNVLLVPNLSSILCLEL